MEPNELILHNSSAPNTYGNITQNVGAKSKTFLDSTNIFHPNPVRKEYIVCAVFIILSFLSIGSNARVYSIVTSTRRKYHRTVSILVAHLTVITIASNLHECLYYADKWDMLILRAPYFCGVMSFVRNTLHAMFPLNVFAIIYERVRTFHVTETTLLVYRTIFLVWIVAAVGSLPSLFCYKYEPDPTKKGFGKCRKVISFIWLTVYELGRLIFFHIFICCCIAWVLYTIRSKLKYLHLLQPTLTDRIRQKVYRIRFVYCYAILFIILWVSVGLLLFLIKLLPLFPDVISKIVVLRLAILLVLLYYTYCILNPLIYICLNEDMNLRTVLGVDFTRYLCARAFLRNGTTENPIEMATTDNEERMRTDVEISDFSQFTTFGLSEQIAQQSLQEATKSVADEVVVDSEYHLTGSFETAV